MAGIQEATASLKRVQEFRATDLVRQNDLGVMNFSEAVEPASRLIRLYQQLPISALEDFPEPQLEQIRTTADADYNRLSQILAFDLQKNQNPGPQRAAFINDVKNTYNNAFAVLAQFISYGLTKSVDYLRLETEGRALIQRVVDDAAEITNELAKAKDESSRILSEVRKAAAEQGVTQQARYFKVEADNHESAAEKWKTATAVLAGILVAVSFASLWLHVIPGLDTETPFRAVQVGTSKALVFIVIGFMLILASRNYLAHRHNAVVNRHRQNALMTFKALVDAAKGGDATDIVLAHAAACIFAPQETAYSKVSGSPALTRSIIELLPKTMKTSD